MLHHTYFDPIVKVTKAQDHEIDVPVANLNWVNYGPGNSFQITRFKIAKFGILRAVTDKTVVLVVLRYFSMVSLSSIRIHSLHAFLISIKDISSLEYKQGIFTKNLGPRVSNSWNVESFETNNIKIQ